MNVDNQNRKYYRKNANEDLISKHDSDYQYSQSNLKKDIEEEKRNCNYLMNQPLSSESVSINSDIHVEGDENKFDVNSDQD